MFGETALKIKIKKKISLALKEKKAADVRYHVFSLRRPKVNAFRKNHPEIEIKLQKIKQQSLANLTTLTDQAVDQMKSNGFKVFKAMSQKDALNYIDSIISGGLIVKTKSNAAKEINLIEHLKKRGFEVIETDLGDRICQLGNVNPAHPLGPAIHLSVEKVAEIFNAYTKEKLKPDPHELVRWARENLRNTLLKAKVAITGANAIAADTGSIVLTENEGNIRMAVSVPRVLIVVAGIEKIVPTLDDCLNVVKCAAGFGVGQEIGTYTSIISGLADNENSLFTPRGPLEVHVVLLEAGRLKILGTPMEKILQCINCGHCLRVCPVFNEIGEQYGKPFYGGIGVLKVAARGNIDEAFLAGLDLCLGCRRCMEACPLAIPTPDLINYVRRQFMQKHGLSSVKKYLVKNLKQLPAMKRKIIYSSQWIYSSSYGRFRKTRIKIKGRNIIPGLAENTLSSIFIKNYNNILSNNKKVIYFPGCMHNLFFVEVGLATIDLLQRTGCEIILPKDHMCCGYPAIAAGDFVTAREIAQSNISFFQDAGGSVVLTDCPTCQTGLNYYPQLFEGDTTGWFEASLELVARLQHISTYLFNHLEKLGPLSIPGLPVTYHRPCHLKAQESYADEQLIKSISKLAFNPVKEAACCGFGGIFSLDFYNLSTIIRRRRVKDLLECRPEIVVTSCPGCLYHLSEGLYEQGSKTMVFHISELLRKAITV